MRLVDADAILYTHEIEQEAIGKLWGVDDLATAIVVAETVEAIPIKWLKQKYEENDPDSGNEDFDRYLWDSVCYVLTAWYEDQEEEDPIVWKDELEEG